jgi:hypothetical protein
MESDTPPLLESRFSLHEDTSALEKIMKQPEPESSLLEDLLDVSRARTEREITKIQMDAYDQIQDWITRTENAANLYHKKYPDIPPKEIAAQATLFFRGRKEDVQKGAAEEIEHIRQVQWAREREIVTFCEKYE